MAKPKLFVGASLENQSAASALQQELDYDADVDIWHQGTFQPSEYPLESLEGMLDRADFAAFIIAPDDVTLSRERELSTVRDNVIFEFGLFVGRLGRKRVFLVAPRDVKLDMPSDIINLTPLTFDPHKPNLRAAMGSAATDIRAAMRRVGSLARATTQVAIQEEVEAAPVQSSPWFAEADATWTLEDYTRSYFIARMVDNPEAAATILGAFRATSPSEEEQAVWDSEDDWASLLNGQRRTIEAFRARAAAFPGNATLAMRLAAVLDHYGSKPLAVDLLKELADKTENPDVAARALERASNLVPFDLNDVVRYRQRLAVNTGQRSSDATLKTLSKLARSVGLPLAAKGIDEVRLAHSPDDTDLRFELAYQYGDEAQTALSFLHYHTIPAAQRTGAAWNNLGVAYGNLGMQWHAVASYEEASRKGETIADANIARKLLNAGFLEEAKARLQSAVNTPNHHENVIAALSDVQDAEATEASKEKEIIAEAATSQARELAVGTHALATDEIAFDGYWKTPEAEVYASRLENGDYEAHGTFIRKTTSGLGLFLAERDEEVQLTYKLRRFGNLLEGTVSRTVNGAPANSGLFALISGGEQVVTLALGKTTAHEIERGRNYEAVWSRLPQQLTTETTKATSSTGTKQ